MQIDYDVGIPIRQQRGKRASLRGVKLHLVPIQIETLGIGSRPHAPKWPVLTGAISQIDALVTVGVIYGADEENPVAGPRVVV
jgi:hypothetical protein